MCIVAGFGQAGVWPGGCWRCIGEHGVCRQVYGQVGGGYLEHGVRVVATCRGSIGCAGREGALGVQAGREHWVWVVATCRGRKRSKYLWNRLSTQTSMARHLLMDPGCGPFHPHPAPIPPHTCPMRLQGMSSIDPPHCHARHPISMFSPPQCSIFSSNAPISKKYSRWTAKSPPAIAGEGTGSRAVRPAKRSFFIMEMP